MQLGTQVPLPTRAQVQILALPPTTWSNIYQGLLYPFLKWTYDETLGFGGVKEIKQPIANKTLLTMSDTQQSHTEFYY